MGGQCVRLERTNEQEDTMKNFKRMLSLILAFAMVLSLAAMMTACGEGKKQDPTDSSTATTGPSGESGNAQKASYTVTVKSVGGLALEGIEVYAYTDDAMTDVAGYAATDANGLATLSLPAGGSYKIGLERVPKGYQPEASYSFSGNTAAIALTSTLVTDEEVSGATLGLGDVMYDFTVTTSDGETVTLSEVLQEKKMVLLNFWYTTCTYCVAEFPFMEQAYQEFKDDVEVIAVNPLDDASLIAPFKAQQGLSFPMATCPAAWSATFGLSGYPTSFVIDRYGVISLVEVGGITSLRPFTSMFEHFTAEDYTQSLYEGVSSLVSNVKPNVTMDTSENVAAIVNQGEFEVTYRPETEGEDAEYAWPFVAAEKNGETCLKASNTEIGGSYAILYADIYLEAGQAVGFDYITSSELGCDVMHVIVNDEAVYSISGYDEVEQWKSCYPCVADKAGTYELALCYIKDDDGDVGDDTVYIKDMRVIDASEVDADTYLPRQAAVANDDGTFTYADIYLNEADGYYHVGSADGPLLLADLMGYTQFSEEETLWDIVYDGGVVIDGVNYYDALVNYFSYASNSSLSGVCTVNAELAQLLKDVASVVGFEDDENEWLKMCKYYQAYGKDVKQLQDPIAGLAEFSAYTATEGKNVDTNYFYYDRPIIPRGLFAEFVPSKSGVYRITSRNESQQGVEGWIFGEGRTELLVYERDERMYEDSSNVSMLYYMEAGTSYYIDIAFWDVYEYGYIYYDIEYVGADMELFRLASQGYFTYDSDATGNDMYHVIAGGIDVVLGEDGLYYEDKGLDANGNQIYGSLLYCDFIGVTSLFSSPVTSVDSVDENGDPIVIKGMIELGGFNFSLTENDQYIQSFLDQHDGDVAATDEYLQALWGADYEALAAEYQIEDVFEGKYHGDGEDMTEVIESYVDKMYNGSAEERVGCVVVDETLAEVLQMLMDKYTFEDVDHSWTKMCYYYDYLGPEA